MSGAAQGSMCHHLKEKAARRTLVPQCTSPCSMWYGVKSSMKVDGAQRLQQGPHLLLRQQRPLMAGPEELGMPGCLPSTSMFTCEGHL